jgi:hypothetical protein
VIIHLEIEAVFPPRHKRDSSEWCIIADVKHSGELKRLIFSADAVRQYFYPGVARDGRASLYELLQADEALRVVDLRLAWRVRAVGTRLDGAVALKTKAERAFNLLANPTVRSAYDASLVDAEVQLPFPYGASGACVVAGKLSDDGATFFADSILAFKPNLRRKRMEVLLRQCEFLPGLVTFRDSKRKTEVWLDAGLLGGVTWDSTWNRWKQWLRTRITIESDFVESPRVHLEDGKRLIRSWWIAMPSRTTVATPESLARDIERAREFHDLIGRHSELLGKIRETVVREPIDASTIQFWFDELGASPELQPEFATWQPDYDDFYFDQLRQRARTWFLFRDEYLFVLPGALVSEIPKAGHASYLFAEPADVHRFLRLYSGASRNDIRLNKANIAKDLGFVGRVVRGTNKERWLADVTTHLMKGRTCDGQGRANE